MKLLDIFKAFMHFNVYFKSLGKWNLKQGANNAMPCPQIQVQGLLLIQPATESCLCLTVKALKNNIKVMKSCTKLLKFVGTINPYYIE